MIQNIKIVLITIGAVIILKGTFLALFPKTTQKIMLKFKNQRDIVGAGLIGIILGLLMFFLISF